MVLAFAGHRPEKLPWGMEESDPRCTALRIQIADAVTQAVQKDFTTFLCGMARGCDFWFAEAVLKLKTQKPELRLEAYLPCPSQPDRWRQEERNRYERLLLECDAVHMVEPVYSEGCMLRRNEMMIDRCDELLTVWDGSRGGTAAAIRYARKTGKPVTGLWL